MIICVAEDRESCEPGLRLLISSLDRWNRSLPVHVFYPPGGPAFKAWLARFPQVVLRPQPVPGTYSTFNVKPHAILYLLDQGFDEIVWIDTDIIVTKNILETFNNVDANTMVITEEALWGVCADDKDALRALLWGFEIGRTLPFALNTSVLRVTSRHHALLTKWKSLVESNEYTTEQAKLWSARRPHMFGDQDVLTALLCSSEFSDVSLKILYRGFHIIQYFGLYGYTITERLRSMFFGLPPFIHSQGPKPWNTDWDIRSIKGIRHYIDVAYHDLSPYTLLSIRPDYKDQAAIDGNANWQCSHLMLSTFLRAICFSYIPLVGLPIALAVDVLRFAKRIIIWRPNSGYQPTTML